MLCLFESKVKIFQDSSDMGVAEPESLEKKSEKTKNHVWDSNLQPTG